MVIGALTFLAVLVTAVTMTALCDWPNMPDPADPPRHKRRSR